MKHIFSVSKYYLDLEAPQRILSICHILNYFWNTLYSFRMPFLPHVFSLMYKISFVISSGNKCPNLMNWFFFVVDKIVTIPLYLDKKYEILFCVLHRQSFPLFYCNFLILRNVLYQPMNSLKLTNTFIICISIVSTVWHDPEQTFIE